MNAYDHDIVILDHGSPLRITFEDCVKYHGRTSIGGVALGFRLIQRALADLAPDGPPERATISVVTAFPGPGLRDAIEMVTRAASRNAYVVDPALGPDTAPEAAAGRLWFEVTVGSERRAYVAAPGAMTAEFIALARRSKQGPQSAADAARWTELKEALAAALMAMSPEEAVRPA